MTSVEPVGARQAPVTVVIPTYNRAADLQRALRNLGAQSAGRLQVVIVDNSSTDNTKEVIEGLMPSWEGRLRYIRKKPEGPAAARNTGMAAATTPYVLFHDSDVELTPDWVERALAHLEADASLGAVGGYIVYAFEPGRVNAYGGDLGRMGLAWDIGEGSLLDSKQGSAPRIWINCSAMLARVPAVQQAGGFDETFFYGYEDSDVGWRLNITGHRVAVFPDLVARHHVEPSPGGAHAEIVFHYCKNRLRSVLRNAGGFNFWVMTLGYAAYTLLDLIARGPRGAKLRALRWNLARWGETMALRRTLQVQRKVADADIFALGERRWLPPTPLGGQRRRPVESAASTSPRGAAPVSDDRV
ncbi:glycosyltransferase family 2 protein [Piscinibacter terrae]|uniref:Glycosyltransferase family 2 protein n=1 Tax=Piscinibacter terrae TaxID=2496871 RepID=A0A3N7HJ78_9BURK|nr:glycosyltransferase family 2 protein [Albitalea terrae]RQP22107.1 glycosyltransferase family 2 protein [Albitalea terrae]